jgi:hypothetical protein
MTQRGQTDPLAGAKNPVAESKIDHDVCRTFDADPLSQ